MTDKHTQAMAEHSNMEKDPGDWVTGDEPMTGAQRSYLKTLCEEAHEPFDDTLTKAQASQRIDELQARTGRGRPAAQGAAGEPGPPGGARSGAGTDARNDERTEARSDPANDAGANRRAGGASGPRP